VFLQKNMEKRDRVTTNSKEQIMSSVCARVQGEIASEVGRPLYSATRAGAVELKS
jgi:hypothetical protein